MHASQPWYELSRATAQLWGPLALTAFSLYFSVRMHGGGAFIPFVVAGAAVLGWVESRGLKRRGHACESHGAFLLLGVVLGVWLAGIADTALVEVAERRYQWPDRPVWRTALIDGGLASAIAFWFVMGASQCFALRRQLRGAGLWMAANLAAGVSASAGLAWALHVPGVLKILGLFVVLTAAAVVLAMAVTRLPVVTLTSTDAGRA